MSKTKRTSSNESLRPVKPYKRKKHSDLLRDFEASYIVINQDPVIQL